MAHSASFLLLFITSFLVSSSLHSQVPAYVPTNGLVGYWPFNGNANDESGNGNHGILSGNISFEIDRDLQPSRCAQFTPSSVIYTQNIQPASCTFTFSVWVKIPTNYNSGGAPIRLANTAAGNSSQVDKMIQILSPVNNVALYVYPGYQIYLTSSSEIDDNNWHHIVASTSPSGMYMYIDNALVASNNNTGCENFAGYWRMEMGNGMMDDLGIYNRALTQEEITALYNGTTTISGCTNSNACNYNASATQDDGSCTYPAQTYLNCAGSCINDADNDGTCDELETPTLPSYLPSNGLVGYWPFNGNANDESGNGNHGTVNGATLSSDRNGNANSAYSFDGQTNYINVPHSGTLNVGNELTISVLLKSISLQNGLNALIKKGSWGGCEYQGYSITIDNGGGSVPFGLGLGYGVNGNCARIETEINTDNNWHHLLVIYSPLTSNSLFLDGYPVSSIINFCPSCLIQNSVNPLVFGLDFQGYGYGFHGQLDDIAIYNRALTQEEITALYNGTTNGGGGNGGTAGTPAQSVPQGIPYQAMIRDNNGAALMNTPVTVRFSLHQDAIDGTVEYQETHNLTTNAFGLINTHFGTGTATQGTFAGINWSNTTKFIQVEANTGGGFVEMGTQQMMSVPFALKANESTKVKNAGLPVFADNAAALAGGLVAGDMYRTAAGALYIVY